MRKSEVTPVCVLTGTMSHSKRQREEADTFDLDDSPPPSPVTAAGAAGMSRAARLASRAAQRRRVREAAGSGAGDASPIQLAGDDEFHEPFSGTSNNTLAVLYRIGNCTRITLIQSDVF